jgi:aryl-alcohol dehydrogenase-like predicted oxidoreductase
MKMPPTASLPRIGLGMAALGRPGYINLDRDAIFGSEVRSVDKMQAQANMVLDALFRRSGGAGMTWVDCARSYGLSERFVGEYLKQHDVEPNNVFVSSKWGYSKSPLQCRVG